MVVIVRIEAPAFNQHEFPFAEVYLRQVDASYSEVIVVISKKHQLRIPNQPTQDGEPAIDCGALLAIYERE
jgi:hypothetical protein